MKNDTNTDLYVNIDGILESECWMPSIRLHRRIEKVEKLIITMRVNGFLLQVHAWPDNWFYIDTGCDGHAVLGRDNMKRVLGQTLMNLAPDDAPFHLPQGD